MRAAAICGCDSIIRSRPGNFGIAASYIRKHRQSMFAAPTVKRNYLLIRACSGTCRHFRFRLPCNYFNNMIFRICLRPPVFYCFIRTLLLFAHFCCASTEGISSHAVVVLILRFPARFGALAACDYLKRFSLTGRLLAPGWGVGAWPLWLQAGRMYFAAAVSLFRLLRGPHSWAFVSHLPNAILSAGSAVFDTMEKSFEVLLTVSCARRTVSFAA